MTTDQPEQQPATAPAPPATTIDQKTYHLIVAADLANIVKKVKSGKPLSKAERELVAAKVQAPATIKPPRPPQRYGNRRSTDAIMERTEEVGRWMAMRWTKTRIHQEAKERWGVHWNTANRYMVRARKLALKALKTSKEEHLADAIAFNEAVLSSPDADWRAKLDANKDKSELIGLYPPKNTRTELSGPDGKPLPPGAQTMVVISTNLTPEELPG